MERGGGNERCLINVCKYVCLHTLHTKFFLGGGEVGLSDSVASRLVAMATKNIGHNFPKSSILQYFFFGAGGEGKSEKFLEQSLVYTT